MDSRHSGSDNPRRSQASSLAFLFQLNMTFAQTADTTALVDGVLSTLVDAIGLDACAVGLVTPTLEAIQLVGAAGLARTDRNRKLPRGCGVEWAVVESGEPVYIPDMLDDGRVDPRHAEIRSSLYVPLVLPRGTVGLLTAHRRTIDAFRKDDLYLLTAVGRYLAGAFEAARLQNQLCDLSLTRPFPRASHRRCAAESRRGRWSRARRHR
jgi:GAF domain-containing protein